jgi:predicted amidohydrolase YtcJ
VHVHTIGDRAARSALDAYEVARTADGTRGRRHTITHLELIDPADWSRFAQLGVIPSFTLNWAGCDSFSLDATRPYIGDECWRRLYPARRVLPAAVASPAAATGR